MKKNKLIYSFLFIAVSGFYSTTLACDVCGCAAMGGYNGILPQYKTNTFGLSYFSQHFTFPVAYGSGDDYFNTFNISARRLVHPKVLVNMELPLSIKLRKVTGENNRLTGLGDAKFFVHYFLINTADSGIHKVRNTLQIVSGIKIPTGKYMQRDKNLLMYPVGFQLGNGSWAAPVMLNYIVRKGKLGLIADAQYWFNSENELGYKMGNFQNNALKFFYWKSRKGRNAILQLGAAYQNFQADKELKRIVNNTGGKFIKGEATLDFTTIKYSINCKVQAPIWTNLPAGQPIERRNFTLGFYYFLSAKK